MPATAIAVTRVSLLMNGEKNEFLIVMAIVSCWLAVFISRFPPSDIR